MPTYSIIIKSLKSSIVVKSYRKKDIHLLKSSAFLRRYIPNVIISERASGEDCELVIKKGKDRIDVQYPRAIYYSDKFNEKDVISLAEYLLERARQESGLYCIHGSACMVEGRTVVFWGGASGMGKTTLCDKLQKYGAVWFADEKIIIDSSNNQICGWINTAYLKNKKNNFRQISAVDRQSIPIAFFIYPLLTDDSCSKLIFDKWPSEKFQWHLFEEFNRKIRATSRLFFSSREPVLPIDTLALARKRVAVVKNIVKQSENYFARGNSENICKNIFSLIKKSILV